MSEITEDSYPYNIPRSFQYSVAIDGFSSTDGSGECTFHEVSGLNMKMTPEAVNEGGINNYVHKLPSKITYDNLVLKRGILKGSSLITWINNALFNYQFQPKTVTIQLIDESNTAVISWSIAEAYPVSLQVSQLNSMENSLVIETFELAYSYYQRVKS